MSLPDIVKVVGRGCLGGQGHIGREGLKSGRSTRKGVNRGQGGQLKILGKVSAAEVNTIIEIFERRKYPYPIKYLTPWVSFDLLNIGLYAG